MPKKKKGVDQRVKGNAKSASSQRMMDLMGGGVGSVIGFSSVSGVTSSRHRGLGAESHGAVDETLYGESSQFQGVMKQLGKRDPTTKLKALQEFASLVQQLSPSATVAILSLWTVMYNKLSMDNDNRVRDHAHRALRAVVEVVHDGMESHLRSIIGCWVAGMCDSYAPSATSARLAFETAFSAEKQEELYRVMMKPIIQHVKELVLKLTPDTYSDPKVLSSEERVQRYERAVCMSVGSLKLVFQNLSQDQLSACVKSWEEFLSEKKLWALTRHSSASVRAALYGVVPVLCLKVPEFVREKARLFCSSVLGALGEKDPIVVGPVWEAALMIVAKTESWHSNVNVEKALLPGLWSLLKEGGHGCASIAYPCLLPLVSRLMEKVYPGNSKFASTFLDYLFSGLSLSRPQNSRKEFEAQLRAFRECLVYLVTNLDHDDPEAKAFIEGAFEKVMEMVCVCLEGGQSVVQSEVLLSNTIRLLGILLHTKCHALQPHLSHLQLSISKKVSVVLEHKENVERNFSRVDSLLKCFCSHTLWTHLERKTVRLPSIDELSVTNLLSPVRVPDSRQEDLTREELEQTSDDSVREFIAPTICSLCSCSIAEVSSAPHLLHSQLLLTMLRLYVTKSLIKAVFSSLESTQAHLLRDHRDEKMLHKKLLIICGILSKAARVRGRGMLEHPEFTCNIVEAVLVLIKSEFVETASACMFLAEFVKPSPVTLPLVLLKLRSTGQHQLMEMLVQKVRSVCGQLFVDLQQNSSPFLWDFLGSLFSEPSDSAWKALDLSSPVFETVCSLLLDQLQDELTLPREMLADILQVVAVANSSVLEDNMDAVASLLSGLLHWCLFDRGVAQLVKKVVSCYRSLLASLPDSASIIQSLPSLVTHHSSDGITSYLVSAQFYYLLHEDVLQDPAHLLALYEPFVRDIAPLKDRWLPLSMLETFCHSPLLYCPFATDLKSAQVTSTLAPPLCPLLYPIAAFANYGPVLQNLVSQSDVSETERQVLVTLEELGGVASGREYLRGVVFGGDGEGVSEDMRESLDGMGVAIVSLLPLVAAMVTDTSARKASSLERKLCECVEEMLRESVEGVVSARRHRWVRDLLQTLHQSNRTFLEGPVLSVVLSKIFVVLEESYADNLDTLRTTLEMFLQSHDSMSIFNAFCVMETATVEELVQQQSLEKCSDGRFLVFLMNFSPQDQQLPHSVCNYLRDVVQGDALFENLVETSQDQLSYTVLELYRLLVAGQTVSKDCWDFLLCSLVSLTQLMREDSAKVTSDGKECQQSQVNVAVLRCRVMQLLHSVTVYCNSADCPQTLTSEWREFFQPALQESLLAIYNTSGSAPHRRTPSDPCLWLQQQCLCRALVPLCLAETPDIPTFTQLVGRINSQFYPDQVTSYLICKRVLEGYEVVSEDGEASRQEKSISVRRIQEILTGIHEKINMDLVYLEDQKSGTGVKGLGPDQRTSSSTRNPYTHTSSYLFLWMLMIETVRRCNAEVRVVMVNWLKDLSLFDHFLQGLFKYLSEDSNKSTDLIVKLYPSLDQLCFLVYCAVAKQLPSMLRQWHLSLDRQTAALVSKFTTSYVSSDLRQADLRTVSLSQTTVGNMEVRVYSGVSEVAITYKVDDFSIELFVSLPDSYPLQPPSIREGKRVKMDPAQWRKWMLQLTIFVTNQNGSLLDGLLLWKSNLDKHFSGAEECMICFSVIHGSTYTLPKMMCRTCKKKFHSTCLYKWFNTSTKSSCPLCRNIF